VHLLKRVRLKEGEKERDEATWTNQLGCGLPLRNAAGSFVALRLALLLLALLILELFLGLLLGLLLELLLGLLLELLLELPLELLLARALAPVDCTNSILSWVVGRLVGR
jgi:hypothetical protein